MDLAFDNCSDVGGLKKGPWTSAEDTILVAYVTKHGEGNWNSVQKHSGLSRCGKSCRLRWANHLRPNLKKGAFTPDEERTIVDLHAKLGNKWARMAAQATAIVESCARARLKDYLNNDTDRQSQLPGRTDNEIKNYWNTRIKRRMRSGLPVYPSDRSKSGPTHYHSDPSGGRIMRGGSDCDFPSSLTQVSTQKFDLKPFEESMKNWAINCSISGDQHQNNDMSNVQEKFRGCFSMHPISVLPLEAVTNHAANTMLNKRAGSPVQHIQCIGHGQDLGNVVDAGAVSISQLSDRSMKTVQPHYKKSSEASTHNTLRADLSRFGNESDWNIPVDGMYNYGLLSMPYDPIGSNASLKLELPLSQSAESVDSAGTQQSSTLNANLPMSFPPPSHMISDSESYGSNASNFLEALMQDAHATEGLDQVRTDLIDQLLVLTSANTPPDVAALLSSSQKGRWGEDSDPTTPLGGQAYSLFSEEVTPMCQRSNWRETQSSTMQPLLVGGDFSEELVQGLACSMSNAVCRVHIWSSCCDPTTLHITPSYFVFKSAAPVFMVPRVEENPAELAHGGIQQCCTDEDLLTLLDFANTEAVPEGYDPPEYYSMEGFPGTPMIECMDVEPKHQLTAALDSQAACQNVSNHVWELGSCPWNASSGGCHEGELLSVEYKPQTLLRGQRVDRCATC